MPDDQEAEDMSQKPTLPPSQSNESSAFRHDLRNALSPALLCADILSSHPDDSVRRHAETIIQALEKALSLLKSSASSR
ncbi:hypothetical protein NBRC3257_2110 [Gluconobacter thailandicus NBRC 3257]|uniref:Uncharacterized protein n=2 Tax=Gluconobacter thailandicus TaxID=257438 RepID=A0AAP9ES78_GLUTH|nr:hypothetical protein B932_0246 [Gluconobacter oxydans H24]QEH96458.1 hypothetical protein FXF46_09290 [Gluconobacter thailandicus]GAC87286.1 hypothetical protein NBRC3255_0947 [Gluconobacter thailandicus NBRC 3255]GAD27111.1 hypothetical protein NBRC3257_2110 [Gluconobacter thailandicus NBRC 3257]